MAQEFIKVRVWALRELGKVAVTSLESTKNDQNRSYWRGIKWTVDHLLEYHTVFLSESDD